MLQLFTASFEGRKELIQKKMFAEFHVRVDYVLMGKGTSNTRNIAKRCLQNHEKLATALELDPMFVRNLSTILLLFSLKDEKVDMTKLRDLCKTTNNMFYTLYEWAKMRPSVHKLSVHGPDIAEKFDLPQAYFAEDGGEHIHKVLKYAFEYLSCQKSRKLKLEHTFKFGLTYSIPHISLKGVEQRLLFKKKKKMPEYAAQYLVQPVQEMEVQDFDDMDCDDSVLIN